LDTITGVTPGAFVMASRWTKPIRPIPITPTFTSLFMFVSSTVMERTDGDDVVGDIEYRRPTPTNDKGGEKDLARVLRLEAKISVRKIPMVGLLSSDECNERKDEVREKTQLLQGKENCVSSACYFARKLRGQ